MKKALPLRIIEKGSSLLGSWPIRFFAWWVATGYFLFHLPRRRSSISLYRVIFPHKKSWFHLYCAWRQFHSFAATFGDRVDFEGMRESALSVQGREGILSAAAKGQGGIILVSHMGSFEIAARCFQEAGIKHLMIMGEKEAKQVSRNQQEELQDRGVSILVTSDKENSPLGGLEALKFIREGGFVSIAGDLLWTQQRSLLSVRFFDQEVALPSGPYLLSLVSGAPLFTLFTFRVGRRKHQIHIAPPSEVKALSRSERDSALQKSAQKYADALEEMIRNHPFQWYIFEPFFRSPRGF
jgi:predicted LPLAT superfamily acyltransferase